MYRQTDFYAQISEHARLLSDIYCIHYMQMIRQWDAPSIRTAPNNLCLYEEGDTDASCRGQQVAEVLAQKIERIAA